MNQFYLSIVLDFGEHIFLDLIALDFGKLKKKIRTIDLDFGKILFFKAIDQDLG